MFKVVEEVLWERASVVCSCFRLQRWTKALRFHLAVVVLACVSFVVFTMPANAHRPGESYVYLEVDDGPLRGEFHIRFSDLAKLFQLDADHDGTVSEQEVLAEREAIADYLSRRLTFHDGSVDHTPVAGELGFFGPVHARQIQLHFAVPTLSPPPDDLGVSYRFLYDDVDPAHLPMLLFKSNTRMRLDENEWVVSKVFQDGRERHQLSLLPTPASKLVPKLGFVGIEQVVTSWYHLIVVLLLILPCLWSRGDHRWVHRRSLDGVVQAVLTTSGVFTAAFISGLLIREIAHYRLSDWQSTGLLLAASTILLIDNFRPVPRVGRWLAGGVAGLFCGLSRSFYGLEVGIDKGLLELTLPAFALGLFSGVVIVSVAVLTATSLVLPDRADGGFFIRVGSILLAISMITLVMLGTTL